VGVSGDQPPEPGALPLLSHALLETWRRREGNILTFSGYTDAGGVQGAIAKTAESVFQQKLSPEQQAIARSIFLRLTELGEGTQDTRRRALISELLPVSDTAETIQDVLQILAEARLITTDEAHAEVAHEALIREWPTLRFWLNQNREGLRLHRHLTEAAYEWRDTGFDPDELYRGARLEQLTEWANNHNEELNDLERGFLEASKAARKRDLEEAQARQQREVLQAQKLAEEERKRAEAEARAVERARSFNYALIVILLLVIGGAVSLIYLQDVAQEREEVAQEATRASVEARETAVAADRLAIVSTTDALQAATVQALATSDNAVATAEVAVNQTLVAERYDVLFQEETTAQAATAEAQRAMVVALNTELEGETNTFLNSLIRDDTMPMVFITDGSYQMGIANGIDNPLRPVTIDSFYLDQYEVTVQQFANFLNQQGGNYGACNEMDCATTLISTSLTNLLITPGAFEPRPGTDHYPATWISWEGANSYCKFFGVRLPTEAEWEYAARGTDGRLYPWGEEDPIQFVTAIFNNDPTQSLTTFFPSAFINVDRLPEGASPFGVYGMAGGAAEWVQDWYDPDFYNLTLPPGGYNENEASGLRVLRGGSWVNTADQITSVSRYALSPSNHSLQILEDSLIGAGFRCARDAN
jgi:formylglycine-generating enzyme required for sulfatase activity